MLSRVSLLLLLFVAACSGGAASSPQSLIPAQPPPPVEKPVVLNDHIVRGHVFGSNGKAMVLAHAHLMGPDGGNKPVESVQASGDGAFVLPLTRLPAQDKFARVQLSGVDHHVETLIVALNEPVDVEVKLGTYRHSPLGTGAPAEEKPTAMVFLPGGTGRQQHPLERKPDGTWACDVNLKDGQYGYEITGLTLEGHTINGTTQEDGGYAFDDDGDYESRVNVSGGKLRIVFDPNKRPPSGVASTVKFSNAESTSAGLTEIFRRIDTERTSWTAEAQAQAHAGKDPKLLTPVFEKRAADLSQSIADLEAKTKNPLVRQAASIAFFQERMTKETDGEPSLVPEDVRSRAQRVVDEATLGVAHGAGGASPTADALFALFPAALPKVVRTAGSTKADALRRTVIDTHPSAQVVSNLLVSTLKSKTASLEEKREVVQTLRTPRFRNTFAAREAELHDPDRAIAPGKSMPAFEVKSLIAKDKPFTQKSFEGKVYLVDMWATWCKPCLAELPAMHEIFAKYGGGGGGGAAPDPKMAKRTKQFAIMSVSLDDKAETVTKFRTDKAHPMPWLQGFAGTGESAESALKSLTGKPSAPIPFYVLVDDKGKIVASSPELRLSEVPALLDRLLL